MSWRNSIRNDWKSSARSDWKDSVKELSTDEKLDFSLLDLKKELLDYIKKQIAKIKPPQDGKNGLDGKNGINGLNGSNGLDGKNGLDAPQIKEIKTEKESSKFRFVFSFSDSKEIITDWLDLPKGKSPSYVGGLNGKSAYEVALDNGFSGTQEEWLQSISGNQKIVVNVSSNTTMSAVQNKDYIYLVSNSATLTLPSAISNNNYYIIKKIDNSHVTINCTSGQTIDGQESLAVQTIFLSRTIVSDGANWVVV